MKKGKGRVQKLVDRLAAMGTAPAVQAPFVPRIGTRRGPYVDDEVYVIRLDGRIAAVNERACEATGYSEEELLGFHAWEVGAGQTPEGFRALVEALRAQGVRRMSLQNRRKDGTTYAAEAALALERGEAGEHVVARLRDTQSYRTVAEERDQLASLIESSSEAISITTPEGVYTYMNPAGLELHGLAGLEEVVGRSVFELHPREFHALIEGQILPQARAHRWQGELWFRNRRSGASTPCWVTAFPVRSTQTGEVIALAGLSRDISTRKAAERHRERFVALNDVSRRVATSLLEDDDLNRAIGTSLEGVGAILEVDRSYLCRYREDRRWVFRTHEWEPGGAGAQNVQPKPESSSPYEWATQRLVRGEVIRIPDLAVASGDVSTFQRQREQALLLMPVVIHGRLESFFGFATRAHREWDDEEVSIVQIIVDSFARAVERRIADREREMIARDLERSVARERKTNEYKSEFLAKLSHELRAPMNSIVGFAELLGRENVEQTNRERWLASIRNSTDYLLSLVNDVLDLSMIEAQRIKIASAPCSIAETLGEVEDLFRAAAAEKLLVFRTVYDGPVPETIQTDPVRLKQILINLVGNAIKFTEKGEVTVHVGMEPDQGDRRGALYLGVVDTGIGIAQDALGKLFRPFAQVHGAGARVGGTGLGLEISRHLARLLGGEISVRSVVGVGSTFTLRLTLEAAGPRVTAPAPPRRRREVVVGPFLTGRRVLIVDDSADNREVLRFLMTEAGGVCEAAENGALGVKMALAAHRSGTPYDAVLMDMSMPVMDGFEATRELRESGLECPIIALTALARSDEEERCRAVGCVDYFAKPVIPSRLLATVARHVRAADGVAPDESGVERAGGDSSESADDDTFSLAGNPRFAALVRRYVESFPEQVERIRGAQREGAWTVLQTLVHRLRGNASNYGYPEVTEAAGRCEDALVRGTTGAPLEPEVDALVALLEEIPRR